MQNIVQVVCVLALVAGAMSQNMTHHEHTEKDNFQFAYDGVTHLMLVRSASYKCYIWQITSDEMSSVHTDTGMKSIEIRILTEIDDAYYTVVPEVILSPTIKKNCGSHVNQDISAYYLVH